MPNRRKPISFDTTIRNPERIPQFISVLSAYEGRVLDDDTALDLESKIIQYKIFEPTQATLGTYIREYHGKFDFYAEDKSDSASEKVKNYFTEWLEAEPGEIELEKIKYLLKNTITRHKDAGWKGGWESRIHTQFNFLNELGLVRVIKGKEIKISPNGKQMITKYKEGFQVEEDFDESYEQSSFLNAFSKYQINNPFRRNTINVNFFYLVLNVIKYLDAMYNYTGITRQEITFVITWENNDYVSLGEIIHNYREKFGFNSSNETVYSYAMNLMDESTSNEELKPATQEFIESKKNDYKFEKITKETPDEIIRKLRLTMLVSLRGSGRFIDINKNENEKIDYILSTYSTNISFDDEEEYFEYMGKIDENLNFIQEVETEEEKDIKEKTIEKWAIEKDWNYYKNEINNILSNGTQDEILKYMNAPTRLEFLIAIIIKKALPNLRVIANYKADDQGIPFRTASGGNNRSVGADIDVYENNVHALLEPTFSQSRSFQTEHEIPAIRSHLLNSAEKDIREEKEYNSWFALLIAPTIHKEVGNQVAVEKAISKVEIYPWKCDDFVNYSQNVNSINDYKQIREYANVQTMPNT